MIAIAKYVQFVMAKAKDAVDVMEQDTFMTHRIFTLNKLLKTLNLYPKQNIL